MFGNNLSTSCLSTRGSNSRRGCLSDTGRDITTVSREAYTALCFQASIYHRARVIGYALPPHPKLCRPPSPTYSQSAEETRHWPQKICIDYRPISLIARFSNKTETLHKISYCWKYLASVVLLPIDMFQLKFPLRPSYGERAVATVRLSINDNTRL